ncbi:MAG TPA: aminotransferase class I/II-fold pyridoxal phosphate-dependent enzyme [Hyphomicrobiaceae bacterium]|nr:aminotransferase class I/II-fold pyridoxal phosphate-dependent enzyme [Hyphomicrobiaceae bacterium]
MRVKILGGGVAGLAVATALIRRAGITDVEVLERDSAERQATRKGHGLILMQNGAKALRALDAGRVLDSCTAIRRALIQDAGGRSLDVGALDGVYCVTRSAIIEALSARLPAGVVKLGHAVDRIEAEGERVSRIVLADRPSIDLGEGDIVIGAEGWRSPLCRALNPGFERPLSPVREIVTSTYLPELARQLGTTFIKTMFADRGVAFGLLAPTAERVIGFMQFDARRHAPPTQDADAAALRSFLGRLLAGAPEVVRQYLERADYATAHVWHPPNSDLPAELACGNGVLVGDAAHPLLPFTSQGIGAALEDAIILADRLAASETATGSVPEVLARFVTDRRAAVEGFVLGGRAMLASFIGTAIPGGVPLIDGTATPIEDLVELSEADLRAAFLAADVDGDGRLGRQDFGRALALFEADISAGEEEGLFSEIDTDTSGSLSVEEILAALAGDGPASPALARLRAGRSPRRQALYQRRSRIVDLFRTLAVGPAGGLDRSEFALALAMSGRVVSEAEIKVQFDTLDRDGDGRLSLAELSQGVGSAPVAAEPGDDSNTLFSDDRVDRAMLRARAHNYRWATVEPDVIPLTAADPDFPAAREIVEAIRDYAASGYFSYGPGEGLGAFRETAARHFKGSRGIPCTAGEVLATNSAAAALYLVVRALLSPGEEALIADPCDFLFERSVVAAGGTVRRFRLDEAAGWTVDVAAVERLVTPRTRILMICNPHNPTGRVWRREELEALTSVALRHKLWIVSDEVWSDIVFAPARLTSVAALSGEVARRTFTVYGFSKGYGMAGLRLGLVISPDTGQHRRLVSTTHFDETADGVSTLSQIAGIAALEHGAAWRAAFVEHLRSQRDVAVARLNRMPGVACALPEGTFVAFPDVSRLALGQDDVVERLAREFRIALVPGSPRFFGPGAAGHVRLSLATSRAILDEALDRIERGVAAIGVKR